MSQRLTFISGCDFKSNIPQLKNAKDSRDRSRAVVCSRGLFTVGPETGRTSSLESSLSVEIAYNGIHGAFKLPLGLGISAEVEHVFATRPSGRSKPKKPRSKLPQVQKGFGAKTTFGLDCSSRGVACGAGHVVEQEATIAHHEDDSHETIEFGSRWGL